MKGTAHNNGFDEPIEVEIPEKVELGMLDSVAQQALFDLIKGKEEV